MTGKGHSDLVKKLESGDLGPDLGLSLTCCGVSRDSLPLCRPVFSSVK